MLPALMILECLHIAMNSFVTPGGVIGTTCCFASAAYQQRRCRGLAQTNMG
jgi:hypothetical protein